MAAGKVEGEVGAHGRPAQPRPVDDGVVPALRSWRRRRSPGAGSRATEPPGAGPTGSHRPRCAPRAGALPGRRSGPRRRRRSRRWSLRRALPPTSGSRYTGLKGWPMRSRSGWLSPLGQATRQQPRRAAGDGSRRSGHRVQAATAAAAWSIRPPVRSPEPSRRTRRPPRDCRPSAGGPDRLPGTGRGASPTGQARSIAARSRSSAPGAGSQATTSWPPRQDAHRPPGADHSRASPAQPSSPSPAPSLQCFGPARSIAPMARRGKAWPTDLVSAYGSAAGVQPLLVHGCTTIRLTPTNGCATRRPPTGTRTWSSGH